jgi:hypothetical protein
MAKTKPVKTIVGQYFFSYPGETLGKKGKRQWQGQVMVEQTPGVFLCQLFEWLSGFETDTVLIRIERMIDENWDFFETHEAFMAAPSARY